MKDLKWRIINFVQVVLYFTVTVICAFIAMFQYMFGVRKETILSWIGHKTWGPVCQFITRAKYDIEGEEEIDFSKPHIYVMNHQSSFDIIVAFQSIKAPIRFIAKKELKNIPFLGWVMSMLGMVFVDRKKSKEAIKSLREAGRLIREGANIIGYPEGSRSDDGRIQRFKKGIFIVAIEAGVPIVPLAVEGSQNLMPKNTFAIRPGEVKVKFGKPISTSEYTHDDRDALIEKVRNELIDLHVSIGGQGAASENLSNTAETPALVGGK